MRRVFRNLWDSPTVPPKLPLSRMQSRKMMADTRDSEVQKRFRYAGNFLRVWSVEGAVFSSSSLVFDHHFILAQNMHSNGADYEPSVPSSTDMVLCTCIPVDRHRCGPTVPASTISHLICIADDCLAANCEEGAKAAAEAAIMAPRARENFIFSVGLTVKSVQMEGGQEIGL